MVQPVGVLWDDIISPRGLGQVDGEYTCTVSRFLYDEL